MGKIYVLVVKGKKNMDVLWVGTDENKAFNRDLSKVDFDEAYDVIVQTWKNENLISEIDITDYEAQEKQGLR